MTRRHACPTCHAQHTAPRASNLLNAVVRCIAFTGIEVVAALRLDGWVAIGLWAIAAWNVLLLTLLIVGMAQVSAHTPTAPADQGPRREAVEARHSPRLDRGR